MNKLRQFEILCIEIQEQTKDRKYKLTGHTHDRRVTLKPYFSKIARPYLQNESRGVRTFYAAEQVEQICIKMDIPVTDVVSKLGGFN